MNKVLCISVRFKALEEYSSKSYKADTWCGKKLFIPNSAYLGQDYEVQKSEAHWIAEWFLKKQESGFSYSEKKKAWIDKTTGKVMPIIQIERHVPEPINSKDISPDESLIR
jgi:hypothetical protein